MSHPATSLVGSTALSPVCPDAEMIATCAAFCELERAYDAAGFRHEAGSPEDAAAGKERERVAAAQDVLAARMRDLPCTTLVGVQVMAAALAAWDRELLKDGPAKDLGELIMSHLVERLLALRVPSHETDVGVSQAADWLLSIRRPADHSDADLKVPSKTRVKGWWNLVGSALENAAASLVEMQKGVVNQYATPIDFNSLFSAAESEDEEGATLAEVLEIIDRVWPRGGSFKAADLAKFIGEPMQGEETDAQTLKEAFQAAGNSTTGSVTAKSIGRRLTVWAGTPIHVGDETLMIERRGAQDQQKQKNALAFRIRRP